MLRLSEPDSVDFGERSDLRPRPQDWPALSPLEAGGDICDVVAGAEWGEGALSPMISVVTLLAVADIGGACVCVAVLVTSGPAGLAKDDTSSTGETRPAAAARLAELALPKLSFHLLGFLVTGAGSGADCVAVETVEEGMGGTGGTGGRTAGPLAESRVLGMPNIEGGSKVPLFDLPDSVLHVLLPLLPLLILSVYVDEALEARLISLAKLWLATARVSSVSSFGVVGVATEPLPLRAPRFLLLVVEVEREVMPSRIFSSCSISSSGSSTSNSRSIGALKAVLRDDARGGPPNDGGLETGSPAKVLAWITGVACLEEGRWLGGTELEIG